MVSGHASDFVHRLADAFRPGRRHRDGVSPWTRELEELARAGGREVLIGIARALSEGDGLGERPLGRRLAGVVDTLFDHIEMSLATAKGLENAKAALACLKVPEPDGPARRGRRERRLAAQLAGHQSTETLGRLARAAEEGSRDVLACWIQEVVARGSDVSADASIAAFWAALRAAGHPLAPLPLRLVRPEARLPESCDGGVSFGPSRALRPVPAELPRIAFAECAVSPLVRAVVPEPLVNAHFEARCFDLRSAQDIAPVDLLSLPLACTEGASAYDAWPVAPEEALDVLFESGARGLGYSEALGAAYGRLAMWQSAAGLVGALPDAPIERVAEAVEARRWFRFEVDTGWFFQECWDYGIAAFSPESGRVVVLAATGCD